MFYFEQRTFDGRWTPCTTDEPPSERGAFGHLRTIRKGSVKPVPPELQKYRLDAIYECLSPDGLLQAVYKDVRSIA